MDVEDVSGCKEKFITDENRRRVNVDDGEHEAGSSCSREITGVVLILLSCHSF